uniref:Taste receptor type 1 member 3 n=1 Tax=Neogobius melanostomus TaxID=47308 RepID=A0A8C6TXD4_9GOBI
PFTLHYVPKMMKYAVDEVNANPKLLPGIKLGYKIYDTCNQPSVIVRPTLSFLTEKYTKVLSVQCNYTDYETSMVAVIGPNGSEMVSIIGKLLGFFLMPQVGVSYRATSVKFSDKTVYPSFFRTVPSDKWQVEVMVQLIKEFQWNWVAVIGSEEEYGKMGVQEFSKLAEKRSLCVAYQAFIPVYTDPGPTIDDIISNIKTTNVSVIVVFSLPEAAAVIIHKIIGVWIGTTSWANTNIVSDIPGIQSIGTVIGFIDKTQSVDLLTEYTQTLFTKISENVNSTHTETGSYSSDLCPQCRSLSPANISIVEHSAVQQAAFSVYAAIYSVAKALHQLLYCNNSVCDWKPLLQVLKNISFDINGTKFEYDSDGNPNIGYDVIQWVWNGSNLRFQYVGTYLHNLSIDKALFTWHTEDSTVRCKKIQLGYRLVIIEFSLSQFNSLQTLQVPVSTCSANCEPGQVRRVKGFHSCCFDCINCQPGTYQAKPGEGSQHKMCSSDRT